MGINHLATGIHPKVEEFLSRSECSKVLVACSGGADSVYMLHQLCAHAETLGIQLIVAHYNHCWRGLDSAGDVVFVKTLAKQLDCPFVTESCAEFGPALTETGARALRIHFLRAAAGKHDCQCIAYGHQQDDIIETQLQRLARGSGVDGLAAPRPVHYFDAHPTHIRPLLHLTASTIRETLKKFSIDWREDISNQNSDIPRNALRHKIIPILRDVLEHDISKGAARARELLEEDSIALDQFARELLPQAFSDDKTLKRLLLRAAPRAITRRALLAWLGTHQLCACLSASAVDCLVDAIYAKEHNFRLSAGKSFIVLDASTVWIELSDESILGLEPCSVKAGESVVLSTGAVLETEVVTIDDALHKRLADGTVNANDQAYISASPKEIFQIRSRKSGDFFKPLGAPGSKKLSEWFTDRKIPVAERNHLPLVLTDSGIVAWVPGFPPADDLKINSKTKTALKLTYKIRKTTLSD